MIYNIICLPSDGNSTQETLLLRTVKWQLSQKTYSSNLFTSCMFKSFSSCNRDIKILQQTYVTLLLLARKLFFKSLL